MTEPTAHEVVAAGNRLAAEAARFAGLGWMRGTSGNLSEVLDRQPLRLAVTASGVDKGEMIGTDVVVVDHAGAPISVPGLVDRQPSAEAGLHARVVAETGAGAVVHVHALSAVIAARRWPDGVALRDVEMLKGIGRAAHDEVVVVPVIRNSQDMDELGDRFVEARRDGVPAVIVADHGMYVWGADLRQARHHTESIEWLLSFALATADGNNSHGNNSHGNNSGGNNSGGNNSHGNNSGGNNSGGNNSGGNNSGGNNSPGNNSEEAS